MKKLFVLLLAILMMLGLTVTSIGLEVQPGDTVQIPITLNNTNGCFVKVSVSYDKNAFEHVSIKCPDGQAIGTTMLRSQLSVVPSGQFGTLVLKAKSGAANGTYSIKVKVSECWQFNETKGKASASAPSITICDHSSVAWLTTLAATCTAPGSRTLNCTFCQRTITVESIPATGHDEGVWSTVVEPTCITDGEKALTCSACSIVLKTEAISAAGHVEGVWSTVTEPTCIEEGEQILKCGVCSETLAAEIIPSAGHDEGIWHTTTEPTCTENGESTLSCGVCSVTLNNEVIPAAGHSINLLTDDAADTLSATDSENTLICDKCHAAVNPEIILITDCLEESSNITADPNNPI